MSCEVPTSLFCKNIFWLLEILSSTSIFQIWSSRYFCTTTYLNIFLKILPSVWGCQEMHIIQLHAKTQWCSLKNLSESTSFSFWSSLVICTATLFLFCSRAHELSPTYSPPYQTLKSRRLDPLEYFWCMQW